jgi:glycosyltransferase involved in cell wall biosynthesis
MALGKPVVGSRIGGIPELVAHDETGVLFAPGDTTELRQILDALLTDRPRRQRYGAAARKRAEQEFSLRAHNAGLLNLYESIAVKAAA